MARMYSSRNSNAGCYMLMVVLMHLLTFAAAIWAVVEFILYLVKDNPFNWWSLGITVFFALLEIFFFIKFAISE